MTQSRRPGASEMPDMLDVATSQTTTLRWDLARELSQLADHGFTALAVWRPKLSDHGATHAAAALAAAGIRASSLQWAGGFTGGDGRSFAESIADGVEAVEAAAILGAAAPQAPPPVVVLHSGCRSGHTRAHAARLFHDALHALVPVARREGVVLAVEPLHALAASGCSFLAGLDAALDAVAAAGDPAVGIALDLWHFGHDRRLFELVGELAGRTAVVQVADGRGAPHAESERLPPGQGNLPLGGLVAALFEHGYAGAIEFSPVGEAVEALGYDRMLRQASAAAAAWGRLARVPA